MTKLPYPESYNMDMWMLVAKMSFSVSVYDLISRHAVVVMQWLIGLNISCGSSGLTQNL